MSGKTLALVFGVIFVLVGVLGYIPNPIVGAEGIFETDSMHNIVHILFGLILVVVAFVAAGASALWLKIIGVVYLILAVAGFATVPEGGQLLGLVMTNMADHWLHVVLGVVLILAGFVAKKPGMVMPSMPGPSM